MADAPKPDTRKPPNKRVRTPTVIQMEAVECGAAALAIILGYYNKIVPLEELRMECGVSRDGSKAINVIKAARKYGLEAKGVKYELEDLYDKVQFPCILFWNFNHFLVLEGFRGGKAYLSDPATGPRVITIEELDGSFSGVVLTFKPGPEFKRGGRKPSMAAALRRRLEGNEAALMYVVLCGLMLVIPGLIVPTFTRVFIDEYLIGQRTGLIKPLLGGMAATALIRMALTILREYFLLRLETKLSLITSSGFFHHILRLPVSYFSQRFAGEIGSRVAINDKVARIISGRLATTILDCLMLLFYGALMLVYSVPLTLVVWALAGINIVAVKMAARKRSDINRRMMQDEGKLIGTAMGGLKMVETLKATGSEPEFFARWSGYQAKALSGAQDLGKFNEFVNAVPPLVNTLVTGSILLIGGFKVMNGDMTIGMLVAYQTLTASFMGPLSTFVSFGAELQELEGDMNRLDDVLDYPQDVQYTRAAPATVAGPRMIKLSGRVELKNVTFGYNPLEPPLIDDLSLTIEPGQRIALVGGSGSGKSTVSKLIAGLYEPWKGEILFDGIPRDQLPPGLIVNSMGAVDQDIFLFSGTIRDNISMWDSTIPDINITSAAKDAAISSVIENRDGAYQSLISEGGGNFSGGQRQRMEIARALVGRPTMVILDEATSALDPATEVMIDDAMRRRGCTCIIVAHRLSTIRDCDEIVVLYRGRIVQRGTHEEMKDAPGPYAHLIKE
ncbi:MAG TPA: NHLP family bacteriocin export ABC transporter peptidase/permease/ATPase subunit [Thermoanaerobaculia bacterium]